MKTTGDAFMVVSLDFGDLIVQNVPLTAWVDVTLGVENVLEAVSLDIGEGHVTCNAQEDVRILDVTRALDNAQMDV